MTASDGEYCVAEDRAVVRWLADISGRGVAADTTLTTAFRDGFRAGQEHPKLGTLADAALHAQMREHPQKAAGNRRKHVDSLEPWATIPLPSAGQEHVKPAATGWNPHESIIRQLSELAKRIEALEANQQRPVLLDLAKTDFGERLAKLERMHEMRAVVPADSPLGGELSKIRDRLDVLESWSDNITKTVNDRGRDYSVRLHALESWSTSITKTINTRVRSLTYKECIEKGCTEQQAIEYLKNF